MWKAPIKIIDNKIRMHEQIINIVDDKAINIFWKANRKYITYVKILGAMKMFKYSEWNI